ncbi:APC family permease [Knoellia sp. 3-2P3]|uniref:APC family permease n=1 Tax=unclassified Knoellia TaxID=2618719 RepID=UPI0023DC2687|nr:APC family permease [Knoellia sp. 3-2P3]MDF2092923.1 APC family permease [Knoellia sp. 3-2P3]
MSGADKAADTAPGTPQGTAAAKTMTVRQAAFIGVGAMVGAGIFALLGPAGAVAGAAVWISFLLAGLVATLQGYSFGKMGAKFPSGSGLLEYVARGFGDGHFTGVTAWLAFMSQFIITAMVAVSFGGYASSLFTDGDAGWAKGFTLVLLVVMGVLNTVGSKAVARAQGLIVRVVIGILVMFSVVTLATADWSLLAISGYPSLRVILSSVALTFFAYLGFGVITFTARDLPDPTLQLPRAMYIALGIAMAIYVAISLGVYGTLTVDEAIAAGDTAVAEAAKPALGDLGYTLMAVTALFATAGATNSGLYPAAGLSKDLAEKGQFPPVLGRRWGRAPVGLVVMVGATMVMALFLNLSAIASIGSVVALLLFTLVTISHLRVRGQTGAQLWVLLAALLLTVTTLISFTLDTLVEEPKTMVTLLGLLLLAIVFDVIWKRVRDAGGTTASAPPAPSVGGGT